MIDRIVDFSIRWRVLVVCLAFALVAGGVYSALRLPIDAVPDITPNQVQINAVAPAFTPLEMEQYVTLPIEVAMGGIPRAVETRSLSRFGLSQVTVGFAGDVDIYWARQLVLERLASVAADLPPGVMPELAPISTGLGEIFQFTVEADPKAPQRYTLMDLRTILDWFIKPQLRTVPGIVEVNSFGGLEKQYQVLVEPSKLVGYGLTVRDVTEALARNNSNGGGAYIEQAGEQQLLRGVGLIQSTRDIENVVVAARNGTPVFVRNLGEVSLGAQVRQGAATRDGRGETVMGIAMMLKGENAREVTVRVRERLEEVGRALPPGVSIRPFYDRSGLVDRTVKTAVTNLVEGGLVVVAVLLLFLMQLRAGLIVSSAIPLAMLVAIVCMRYFGVSANLMSLGAIDFGLIVDGAVIIVENSVRRLAEARRRLARRLTKPECHQIVHDSAKEVLGVSQFGQIIILAAYLPILSLAGIEGKMFRPMALTVVFALSGALVLSATLIPALCAMFLREPRGVAGEVPGNVADRLLHRLAGSYRAALRLALCHFRVGAAAAAALVVVCMGLFVRLGSEFIPDLAEGAIAINTQRLPSISLTESVRMLTAMEQAIMRVPEVDTVVSRIGRPEIATDPMGPDHADTYVFLKPGVRNQAEISERLARDAAAIPGMAFAFSQPIKFRMAELTEGIGARSDVVIKIYGDDLETLRREAQKALRVIGRIPGAADSRIQQVTGLPVLQIRIDRDAIARYGINVADVQEVIQTAIAGTPATEVLEGFRRFSLVVRFPPEARRHAQAIGNLLVSAPGGQRVPLSQLARIENDEGPAEISRDNGQRRISLEVNVRGRDIGSFVQEARRRTAGEVRLPPGYLMTWGGTWEHMESGRLRLAVAVPLAFALIFLLLYAAFRSLRLAALVFTGIPFAVTGGVLSLYLRGMHFSMSAGVGFIAVSGVAVLNGIVLVAFINQLRGQGWETVDAVVQGASMRLRPVLMTALVASLGFVPMALSTGAGAEVQKPLATVVIGGLVTSTILTLLLLPALYAKTAGDRAKAE